MEKEALIDGRNGQVAMEDMIIHENIFNMGKVLSGHERFVLSDHLYNIVVTVLSPMLTYSQKARKLKGLLSRAVVERS